MKNLNEYYKQIKLDNSPNENDFAMLLSKVNTRTEVRENFYKNNNNFQSNSLQKVRSPFFAWSFGFAGFTMAAFMFFVTTNNQVAEPENLAIADQAIMRSSNVTVDKTARKAKVSETIDLIDSIDSFNMKTN